MTGTYYPAADSYYAPLTGTRPVFQGDVFAGAFSAFWAHPAAVAARRAAAPVPIDPPFPATTDLLADVRVDGPYALLLPHPCDYSEDEKGATHPIRLVAPVVPASSTRVPVKTLRAGTVGHLMWLPKWEGLRGEEDWAANLRLATALDTAFLSRAHRQAALGVAAWVAMNDKVTDYFTGMRLDRSAFVLERADLHPDAP